MKDSQKQRLIAVSGQQQFNMISEGIESSETGYIVSEDALTQIAEALEAAADTSALDATNAALVAAQEARQQAEDDLATANQTIATLTARVEELEEEPGISQTSKANDEGKGSKVAFHESDANPFNQIADGLFGKPKKKD